MRPDRIFRHIYVAAAFTGLLALTACASTQENSPPVTAAVDSEMGWNEQLIDSPDNPEDLIQTSSGAVIISAMSANPGSSDGAAGSLYTMDPTSGNLTKAWPHPNSTVAHDTTRFNECPGPPDTAVASPHGLGSEITADGTEYLYVINHGGRESVEVFEVNTSESDTPLTWVGCSVLPDGSFGNGIVQDPNSNGFYVTHFLDPADIDGEFKRAFAGEITGEVLHWTPETGWREIPGSEMSTPNGLAISEDGSSLYVASWTGRELIKMDVVTGERIQTVALEFMPDNLRPTADGQILVTGQVIDDLETFMGYQSGDRKPEDRYDVYTLSPDTFTVKPLAAGCLSGFNNPTTALEVNGQILVGSVAGNKILQLDPA